MDNPLRSMSVGTGLGFRRFAGALALGSGLIYLLDPESGRRRRARLSEKATHVAHLTRRAAHKTAADLENRGRGLLCSARSVALRDRSEPVPDEILVERVRSRLGTMVSHPHAVTVTARDGVVTLAGPILEGEASRLIRGARHVSGVRRVVDHLERHEPAEHVPGLQGDAHRNRRPELFQESWAPAIRLMTGAAGGALLVGGLAQSGPGRLILGGAGSLLLARALTNLPMKRLFGVGAGYRAIDVEKAIWIAAQPDRVFGFVRNLRNLPRFMSHLESVVEMDGARSHWVARGPAGIPVTWDVELTLVEKDRLIAWRSTLNSTVRSAGTIRFEPDDKGRTLTSVRLSYNPPAGAIGHAVSRLFGADPKRALDDDMLRLKSLIENGKASAHGHTVTREELVPPASTN